MPIKNNNLQNIVEEIKKIASPPPPVDSVVAPPPSTSGLVGSLNAVKSMQQAIQSLGQTVSEDSVSAITPSNRTDIAVGPQADQATRQSKKAFNDFIASNYMANSPTRGVELGEGKTYKDKEKTKTGLHELSEVMKTLRNIGSSKNEVKIDGVWGPKTDNALWNIMAFADGLIKLETDLGLDNTIYPKEKISEFRKDALNSTETDAASKSPPAEKQQKAIKITKHIKEIIALYNDFRAKVTGDASYKTYIEGNKPLDSYGPQGSNMEALTPADESWAKMDTAIIYGVQIPDPNSPNKMISRDIKLSTLRDKSTFDYFLKFLGYSDQNLNAAALNVLQNIKAKLSEIQK